MIALTTPVVIAITVRWDILCSLVMIVDVDVVVNSSKVLGSGLIVVLLSEVLTVVESSCQCTIKIMIIYSVTKHFDSLTFS